MVRFFNLVRPGAQQKHDDLIAHADADLGEHYVSERGGRKYLIWSQVIARYELTGPFVAWMPAVMTQGKDSPGELWLDRMMKEGRLP